MPINNDKGHSSTTLMGIFKELEQKEMEKYGISVDELISVAKDINSSELEKILSTLILKIVKNTSGVYSFYIPDLELEKRLTPEEIKEIANNINSSILEIKLANNLLKIMEDDKDIEEKLNNPNGLDFKKLFCKF